MKLILNMDHSPPLKKTLYRVRWEMILSGNSGRVFFGGSRVDILSCTVAYSDTSNLATSPEELEMKKITTITAFICVWVLCFILVSPVGVQAGQLNQGAPSTHAQAFALIDVTSGRILYSSHGDQELPIASLTKIMTAIVAIEHGKLDEMVTVGRNAFAKEGSSLYLQLGEEMSLRNMLYGLMLRSGNDAATAIAEHIGGSEEGFAHLMNEKARLIGLEHTHFQNPHGLDAKDHYSSANDLAKLTAYALHNPDFKEIVSTRSKKAPNPNDPWIINGITRIRCSGSTKGQMV